MRQAARRHRPAFGDQRRHDIRAYTNPEEMIGSPQNPRRIAVGFDVRLR
jgi:hypothetical protein